jgi:5-(carboxyamino)imidazole ribonucleotide mutase
MDSVLSILQMPGGVPVATVALNGAKNAGILAAQIIGSHDKEIMDKMIAYKLSLKEAVYKSSEELNKLISQSFIKESKDSLRIFRPKSQTL